MDFCNENNFEELVLNRLFPEIKWVRDKTIPQSGLRTRPDFCSEKLKLIVEYNGYRHYIVSHQILRDYRKTREYQKLGYKVVDWPFWIQPDKNTTKTLFWGFECDFDQHFSEDHQGFMSKWASCVLPADFCELGIERFEKELAEFPKITQEQVLWSLKNRVDDKHTVEEVAYKKLRKRLRTVSLNGIGKKVF